MNMPTAHTPPTSLTRPMKNRTLESASHFYMHHTRCGHRPIDIHQVFPSSLPKIESAPPPAWKQPKFGPIFMTTKAKSTPEIPTFSLLSGRLRHHLSHAITDGTEERAAQYLLPRVAS